MYENTKAAQELAQLKAAGARKWRRNYAANVEYKIYTYQALAFALREYLDRANDARKWAADARARMHVLDEDQYYA